MSTLQTPPAAKAFPRVSFAVSVIGHAAFLMLALVELPRVERQVAAVEPVEVTIETAPAIAPPTRQENEAPAADEPAAAPSPTAEPPEAAPPEAKAPPRRSGRIVAETLGAGAVLADPRNRALEKRLGALGDDERVIQICNIEAVEQVRRIDAGLAPDHVVAYAMAEPTIAGNRLVAKGAAIHGAGRWLNLAYVCTAAPDRRSVTAFEFRLGRDIPPADWESHALPAMLDGDDTD